MNPAVYVVLQAFQMEQFYLFGVRLITVYDQIIELRFSSMKEGRIAK